MQAGSLLTLTITMDLNNEYINLCERKQYPLIVLKCPHRGAVEHLYTISVPLNQATLALSAFTRV